MDNKLKTDRDLEDIVKDLRQSFPDNISYSCFSRKFRNGCQDVINDVFISYKLKIRCTLKLANSITELYRCSSALQRAYEKERDEVLAALVKFEKLAETIVDFKGITFTIIKSSAPGKITVLFSVGEHMAQSVIQNMAPGGKGSPDLFKELADTIIEHKGVKFTITKSGKRTKQILLNTEDNVAQGLILLLKWDPFKVVPAKNWDQAIEAIGRGAGRPGESTGKFNKTKELCSAAINYIINPKLDKVTNQTCRIIIEIFENMNIPILDMYGKEYSYLQDKVDNIRSTIRRGKKYLR